MVTLSSENFKSEISDYQGVAVVLFTTPDPLVTQAEDYFNTLLNVKFGVVDFDSERGLVHKFSVRELPLFLVFTVGRLTQTLTTLDQCKKVCGGQ